MAKFTRYIHAARGARLVPDTFTKYDYSTARADAINKFDLRDIYLDKSVFVELKQLLSQS